MSVDRAMSCSCCELIKVLRNRYTHEDGEANNEDVASQVHISELQHGNSGSNCSIQQQTFLALRREDKTRSATVVQQFKGLLAIAFL